MRVCLASTSPARLMLLQQFGIRPLTVAPDVNEDAVVAAMVEGIRTMGLGALAWTPEIESFRQRIAFLRTVEGEGGAWPDLSDAALLENLETWLAPFLAGVTRRAHLARIDLRAALDAQLDWKLKKRLDEAAPTHVAVPSGSRIAIDYSDPAAPVRFTLGVDDDAIELTATNRMLRAPGGAGYGLVGMRERVDALGGSFDARASGELWTVRAELPLSVAVR